MLQPAIVVTGATGLVGTQVIQYLLTCGYTVHVVVRQPMATGYQVSPLDIQQHCIDLASNQQDWSWLGEVHPVALIHCAAMTNVDGCEQNPSLAYTINEYATRFIALACAQYKIHLLMVSTDYVFDGSLRQSGPYGEDDPVNPINHYGCSKLRGELAVREICTTRSSWTICRTSVVYGATSGTRPDFASWLLTKLRQRETVKIVYDQINTPTYSGDLAMMLVKLAQQQVTGIYHTSGSSLMNRYEFALALVRHFGLDDELIHPISSKELLQAATRPLIAGLRTDKITQTLGTVPLSIEEGIVRISSKPS